MIYRIIIIKGSNKIKPFIRKINGKNEVSLKKNSEILFIIVGVVYIMNYSCGRFINQSANQRKYKNRKQRIKQIITVFNR